MFEAKVEVNGINLYYKVFGSRLSCEKRVDTSQPSIIVIHGGPGADHTPYVPFWSQLAEDNKMQVIFVDLRGHGRSDKSTKETWNLKQWGEDVYKLIQTLGLIRPILVGLSFGGYVAQACAITHSDALGGLILSDTETHIDLEALLARIKDKAKELHLDDAQVLSTAMAWFKTPGPETIGNYFEYVIKPCYENEPKKRDDFSECIFNWELAHYFQSTEAFHFNFTDALARVTCPTLVMAGDYAPHHTADSAREIRDKLTSIRPRCKIFEGAGIFCYNHCDPKEALAIVKDFCAEVFSELTRLTLVTDLTLTSRSTDSVACDLPKP